MAVLFFNIFENIYRIWVKVPIFFEVKEGYI